MPIPKKDDTTYLGHRLGHEFPADVRTVVWKGGNGVRTALPYAQPDPSTMKSMEKGKGKGKKGKEKEGYDLDEDVENVEQMALRPWYEDAPERFAEMYLPPGAEHNEADHTAIINTLRAYLRQNKFIILRGWEPSERVSFDRKSILKWVGSLSKTVEWQGESQLLARYHN
jgi:hypothetical protein